MNFKKNAPGCPCSCGGEPPGPCGCNATQIQIDISNADDVAQFLGTRFSPGPCDFLNFAGFSVVDGTYYVTWPSVASVVLLGEWQSTTGKLTDSFGFGYCTYLKVEFITTVESLPCNGFIKFYLHLETLLDGADPCPDVEDIIWTENFVQLFEVALCVSETDNVSIQTVTGINATDCGAKFWTADIDWGPVL